MVDTLNLEAERAAYLASFPDVHFSGAWTARNEQDFAVWIASAARRSTSSVSEGEMPELWVLKTGHGDRYTAKQPTGEFADKWIPLYRAATKAAAPADAPRVMSYAEMAKWARDNGLNVPPEWERAPAEDAREEVQDSDMLVAYREWLAKRGPLGVGAMPERIFFAGYLAARRAFSVPAIPGTGWKLVPITPTLEMVAAGDETLHGRGTCVLAWRAMVDAAPSHPLEAKAGEPIAGFKVVVDPWMSPDEVRMESGKQSVTMRNVGAAPAHPREEEEGKGK